MNRYRLKSRFYSRSPMSLRCLVCPRELSGISSHKTICLQFVLDVVFASKNNLFTTLSKPDERTMMTAQGWRCVIRKENANV